MMLQIVAHQWGVTFSGPGADFMIAAFGAVTTYIIFVFVWYLVQGVVMANSLFVSYQGDALWGVYGLDLLSAVVRRLDPEGVADSFNYLLALDTYGFLHRPSGRFTSTSCSERWLSSSPGAGLPVWSTNRSAGARMRAGTSSDPLSSWGSSSAW
jgi:hypothetical protein